MIRLARYSERFPASGGVGARTTRRALGPYRLGFWELFLRETIQNSWDARMSADGPISFGVHGWTATPSQREYLRDVILTDPPPHLAIPTALNSAALELLVVADSETWGLGGPTRADVGAASVADGRTDFVDLVRDTGRRASKNPGGGTYGFGKAVLSEASAVSTVVIYSRTSSGGFQSSRFIAMAVGDDEYQERGIRYTGRHWWGVIEDDVAEPILGAAADDAAAALGLHGLITGPTGTAVMVIAPRTPGENGPAELAGIVHAIAEAATEYAWPHMITSPGNGPAIDFSFTLDGIPVPLRDLTTDTRLRMFAEAYTRCQGLLVGTVDEGDDWPWCLRMLRSQRPVCQLGPFVWRHHGPIAASAPDTDVHSEVALIRAPRFVVSYMDVPRHPSGQSTFGVFLADPSLDREFAEAEPPTHDAWIPMKGRHFDPVRRISKQIVDLLKPRPISDIPHDGREESGVVAVASALGGLLDGLNAGGDARLPWSPPPPGGSQGRSGPSGGRPAGNGPQGGHRPSGRRADRQPSIRYDRQPRLLVIEGRTAVEFLFTVSRPAGQGEVRITARPDVFIDGGRETDPPLGAELPELLGWRQLDTGSVSRGSDLVVTQDGESKWSVLISQPTDAAVSVSLSIVGHS